MFISVFHSFQELRHDRNYPPFSILNNLCPLTIIISRDDIPAPLRLEISLQDITLVSPELGISPDRHAARNNRSLPLQADYDRGISPRHFLLRPSSRSRRIRITCLDCSHTSAIRSTRCTSDDARHTDGNPTSRQPLGREPMRRRQASALLHALVTGHNEHHDEDHDGDHDKKTKAKLVSVQFRTLRLFSDSPNARDASWEITGNYKICIQQRTVDNTCRYIYYLNPTIKQASAISRV